MKVIGAVIFGKFKIHENTITNLFLKARKKASFEHVTSCLHILIFLVLYSAVVSVPVSEPIRNKHEFFCFFFVQQISTVCGRLVRIRNIL